MKPKENQDLKKIENWKNWKFKKALWFDLDDGVERHGEGSTPDTSLQVLNTKVLLPLSLLWLFFVVVSRLSPLVQLAHDNYPELILSWVSKVKVLGRTFSVLAGGGAMLKDFIHCYNVTHVRPKFLPIRVSAGQRKWEGFPITLEGLLHVPS